MSSMRPRPSKKKVVARGDGKARYAQPDPNGNRAERRKADKEDKKKKK